MLSTEVVRRVAAPIGVVWSTITSFGAYPAIVRSYVSVVYLTTQTGGLGASWRQTRSVFGREHSQVLRIL